MAKTLKATGLVKVYGKKEVLHSVDVEFESGCIYGLIGRNGAGKTTLLSCITAQSWANAGEITYGGEPVWENEKALGEICFAREISQILFMGQNTYKVRDYLRAAKLLYPHWDEQYAQQLVDRFGLERKKRISALSKGMLSMLTIVLALASNAPITILDEAASVFEKVVILDDGNIIEQGNTDELVAQFRYVSGKDEQVDEAVAGMKVLMEEKAGRSKAVVIRSSEENLSKLEQNPNVEISPLNLQKVFVALTGQKEG